MKKNKLTVEIEKIEGGLPISVIVPLSKRREKFFNEKSFPSLDENNPNEIIIVSGDNGAPQKRNFGFGNSTQPYLFFCDDDIILPPNYLNRLLNTLNANPEKGYSYTGYNAIVHHPQTHPMKGNYTIQSIPFNKDRLKRGNYISTMSLIRREIFPMFDESLNRFQDWDVWLTLLNKGIEGIMVPDILFEAHYLDEGLTSKNNDEQESLIKIIKKHKIF